MLEGESPRVPSKGWAEMIRKVYKVDPMICPRRGGRMKVVAFLTELAVVDRILRHLELTFVAEKPPPANMTALRAAEEGGEYDWPAIGRGKWPALVWPHSGLTSLISSPPAAGPVRSHGIDIGSGR